MLTIGSRVHYTGSSFSSLGETGVIEKMRPDGKCFVRWDRTMVRGWYSRNLLTEVRDEKPSYDPSRSLNTVYVDGVRGDTIVQYLDVLRAHDIVTPKQLNERLGKKTEERRVKVYDSANPDRLLGSLPMVDAPGSLVSYSCCPRMSYGIVPVSEVSTLSIRYVTLRKDRKVAADGWHTEAVLITSETLNDLMLIDGFRLPDETKAQAKGRLHRACYYA